MAPCRVVADDFIDDILKVQRELLHCQVLTLWTAGGGAGGPVPTATPAGSQGLPFGLPAASTDLDRGPLPHGPQTATTEIGHHKRQRDLVILEL